MRWQRTLTRRSERGAVTTIVATLLGGGVLFGVLALSLDLGQLMAERAQVQNGADASSLSLMRSCATSSTQCVVGANSLGSVNNANASDNLNGFNPQAGVTGIGQCGGMVGGGSLGALPPCPPSTGAWADCTALPAQYTTPAYVGMPYVEVRTRSQSSGGSFVRNWVGGLMGQPTSSAGACARAAAGSVSGATAGDLPIAISACEWRRATGGNDGGGGGAYVAPPNYTAYPGTGYASGGSPAWPAGAVAPPGVTVAGENVLMLQNPPASNGNGNGNGNGGGGQTPPGPCPTWQGHVLPGGFSLLATVAGQPCKIDLKPDNWVQTDPGGSTACNLSQYVGKVVSLPVFDCTWTSDPGVSAPLPSPCDAGNGSNAWYHVMTMAKFYLTGYSMTTQGGAANRVASINPNTSLTNNPCRNNESCLSGWFTTGESSGGGTPGPMSHYFGAWVVAPVG